MGNDNYKQGSDFFMTFSGKKEKTILDFPTKSLQNTLTVSVNSNSDAERRAALPGEVLLLLFGSLQRGCGRIMMEAFESECRKTASAPICSGRMKPAISNITARTGLPQSRTFPAPQQSRENTSKPSCSGKRFEENAENIHFRKRAGDVP